MTATTTELTADLLLRDVAAWNAARAARPDELPDLSGAKLWYAKLSGADLSGAKLSGAKLSGANLWYADLSGAELTGADLTGAELWNAELTGAKLSGADLSGADLSGADLTGADLTGANLTGAGHNVRRKQPTAGRAGRRPIMEPLIVTRHLALVELLRERGLVAEGVEVLAHATPEQIRGRHVFGVLPLALAAEAESVTEIPLRLTPEQRGQELSLATLRQIAEEAVTYRVSADEGAP